jgi:hypothetical protein
METGTLSGKEVEALGSNLKRLMQSDPGRPG